MCTPEVLKVVWIDTNRGMGVGGAYHYGIMEANASLVDNRNELVVIQLDREGPKPLDHMNGHIYQIYVDDVKVTTKAEFLVVCNDCAFFVCWPRL